MDNKQDDIIQAVEQCLRRDGCSRCEKCPYTHVGDGFECREKLRDDIIALLKAQKPRVMTPADINNIGPEDVCAFVEIRGKTHMYACYMHQYDETHTEIMCDVPDMPTKLQNGCARLWTSRPTDAQREATPWDVGTMTG